MAKETNVSRLSLSITVPFVLWLALTLSLGGDAMVIAMQ